jgi:hypothetical protein
MKCESMLRPGLVSTEPENALGPRCQPAGSGTFLAYQRASAICNPVCRISSTNWTW